MYGYIYIVTNNINGKQYIGKRSRDFYSDPYYLGSGTLICRSINKYGASNFTKELLEECNSEDELNEREIYWIAKYNAVEDPMFYNLTPGANGSAKGSKRTKETCKKISKSLIGKPLSKEHIEKTASKLRGRHLSEEHKKKLSRSLKGRKMPEWFSKYMSEYMKGNKRNQGKHLSEETKRKISESRIGIKFTDEHKTRLSDSKKGSHYSEQARKNMSLARIRDRVKPPDLTGRIAVTNGIINKRVLPENLEEYLNSGFKRGWTKKEVIK